MEGRSFLPVLAAAILAAAGCFNEPEPASASVKEGQRVYLKGLNLGDLHAQTAAFRLGAEIDYLNLDHNALTNVDEVAALTGLKWLRLNDNQLAQLPDLTQLKNLRRLYLRDNRLTTLPESLGQLPALTDLDVSGNRGFAEVPTWLATKRGLENLGFNGTGLKALPEDLSAWEGLTSLQLGDLSLSAAEMARIRKALPKVSIVF